MNFLRGQSVHMHSFIIFYKHQFPVIHSMLVCCLTNTITCNFQQQRQTFIPRQSKNCTMQMQQASRQASMHSGTFCVAIFFHHTYDKHHHKPCKLVILARCVTHYFDKVQRVTVVKYWCISNLYCTPLILRSE